MARTTPTSDKSAKLFGERLRELRVAKTGLSQEAFADVAKFHRTFISRIERGESNITLPNIIRICEALGVTLAEFFEDFEEGLIQSKS